MPRKVAHSMQIQPIVSSQHQKGTPNPRQFLKLFHHVDKLKEPVLKLAQSICRESQVHSKKIKTYINKQNIQHLCKQVNKNQNMSYIKREEQSYEEMSGQYRSRVSRILKRKRESLSEDENIDRLNARLDYYINNQIGIEKLKELRNFH